MAQIGKIHLGGRRLDVDPQRPEMHSAVAFELGTSAEANCFFQSDDGAWEVETKWGHSAIVARNRAVLPRDDLLRIGYEQIQRALDIVAFETNWCTTVPKPGDSHILLFARSDEIVLQCVAKLIHSVRVHSQITRLDGQGNKITEPPAPRSRWSAPLRFYRLSQTATDLWEAYRNLFLGLESLLNILCPKSRLEKERMWLERALGSVGATVNLQEFVPPGTPDPALYIVDTQYKNIRCRLFHGKGELPAAHEGSLSPAEVAPAYKQLISLWRALALKHLDVTRKHGGVMYHGGFHSMMDRRFSHGLKMFYTEDASPAKREDTEVSPMGLPIHPFDETRYLGETSAGEVSFSGCQRIGSGSIPNFFHRICSVIEDELYAVHHVPDGVCPEGVDILESLVITSLDNAGQPRTSFNSENIG